MLNAIRPYLGNFEDDATAWRSPEAFIFYAGLAVIVIAKAVF